MSCFSHWTLCRLVEIVLCCAVALSCIALIATTKATRPYAGIVLGVTTFYVARLWRWLPAEREYVRVASVNIAKEVVRQRRITRHSPPARVDASADAAPHKKEPEQPPQQEAPFPAAACAHPLSSSPAQEQVLCEEPEPRSPTHVGDCNNSGLFSPLTAWKEMEAFGARKTQTPELSEPPRASRHDGQQMPTPLPPPCSRIRVLAVRYDPSYQQQGEEPCTQPASFPARAERSDMHTHAVETTAQGSAAEFLARARTTHEPFADTWSGTHREPSYDAAFAAAGEEEELRTIRRHSSMPPTHPRSRAAAEATHEPFIEDGEHEDERVFASTPPRTT